MCAIGTTDNGLVECKQTLTKRSVLLDMPVLGLNLVESPPVTEQVKLAACTRFDCFTVIAY